MTEVWKKKSGLLNQKNLEKRKEEGQVVEGGGRRDLGHNRKELQSEGRL